MPRSYEVIHETEYRYEWPADSAWQLAHLRRHGVDPLLRVWRGPCDDDRLHVSVRQRFAATGRSGPPWLRRRQGQ